MKLDYAPFSICCQVVVGRWEADASSVFKKKGIFPMLICVAHSELYHVTFCGTVGGFFLKSELQENLKSTIAIGPPHCKG